MHFLHIGKTENIKQIRKGKILFLDVGVNSIQGKAKYSVTQILSYSVSYEIGQKQ